MSLGLMGMLLKQTDNMAALIQLEAPNLLMSLASTVGDPIEDRMKATRTMDEVGPQVGRQHSTAFYCNPLHSTPLHASALHSTPSTPLYSTPLHSTLPHSTSLRSPAVQVAAHDPSTPSRLEVMMLSLLSDPCMQLRAVGCRGLARAAFRGEEKKIVKAGGP